MLETKYVWMDGKNVPFAKANVHIINHSLHYGSAVFEGIRFYETEKGPAVFRLKEHMDRLFLSAKMMGMKIDYSQKELTDAILLLIRKNGLKSGYIRPIFYYGFKMGLDPTGAEVHAAIAVWEWPKYLDKEVVKIKTSKYCRLIFRSGEMEAKISGCYFNSILAGLDAKKAGYDEALLLDYLGNIAEGPGENIFFVKGKTIHTPQKGTILPGITRNSIIQIAKDRGYKIVERKIRLAEIKKFEEAFFTGTAVEVAPIGQIDKTKIGNGKMGKTAGELKEIYSEVVRGKVKKYNQWLTYVKK
jgi:branched-chain amino acid aminotransferase